MHTSTRASNCIKTTTCSGCEDTSLDKGLRVNAVYNCISNHLVAPVAPSDAPILYNAQSISHLLLHHNITLFAHSLNTSEQARTTDIVRGRPAAPFAGLVSLSAVNATISGFEQEMNAHLGLHNCCRPMGPRDRGEADRDRYRSGDCCVCRVPVPSHQGSPRGGGFPVFHRLCGR